MQAMQQKQQQGFAVRVLSVKQQEQVAKVIPAPRVAPSPKYSALHLSFAVRSYSTLRQELQASFAATMVCPATEQTDPAAAFDVEKAIDVEAPVSVPFDEGV